MWCLKNDSGCLTEPGKGDLIVSTVETTLPCGKGGLIVPTVETTLPCGVPDVETALLKAGMGG